MIVDIEVVVPTVVWTKYSVVPTWWSLLVSLFWCITVQISFLEERFRSLILEKKGSRTVTVELRVNVKFKWELCLVLELSSITKSQF